MASSDDFSPAYIYRVLRAFGARDRGSPIVDFADDSSVDEDCAESAHWDLPKMYDFGSKSEIHEWIHFICYTPARVEFSTLVHNSDFLDSAVIWHGRSRCKI
ncbi:hypothetical protein GCK32_004605 [Trichostrongylus colubriformis]|uniref:Uncharacterized protein n=1 Tax=Trichostrongylus colubriformis TaxID=6319 RepID=A0AAN8INB3_TRICO